MYRVIVTTNRDTIQHIGYANKSIFYEDQETHQSVYGTRKLAFLVFNLAIRDMMHSNVGMNYDLVIQYLFNGGGNDWRPYHRLLHKEIECLVRL